MFIGGGSAGTAGGIKVTTFFLLAFVIWPRSAARRDVDVGGRRCRQARAAGGHRRAARRRRGRRRHAWLLLGHRPCRSTGSCSR